MTLESSWERRCRDPNPAVRHQAALDPGLPEAMVALLASDKSSWVRVAVAGRADLPGPVAASMTADADADVRALVAAHPGVSGASLVTLASDRRVKVRIAVASRPDCPSPLLAEFASDASARVRTAVAANPSLPVVLLDDLADDESLHVRNAVAARADCPPQFVRHFAVDPSPKVRVTVAGRPDCPDDLLLALAQDTRAVRRAVKAHPLLPVVVSVALAPESVRASLAGLSDTSAAAAHRRVWARKFAAVAPDLTPTDASRLAADKAKAVRAIVAGRPDVASLLSAAELVNLAADPDPLIREALASATGLPGEAVVMQVVMGDRS